MYMCLGILCAADKMSNFSDLFHGSINLYSNMINMVFSGYVFVN